MTITREEAMKFKQASQLLQEKAQAGQVIIKPPLPPVQDRCAMCDGREEAMPIGSKCLELTIETQLEKMIEQGKLDEVVARVLAKRGI